jgi:Glycosyl hydrolases family 2
MSQGTIELEVGEVSDLEARVMALYRPAADESIVLRGVLRGPYCERAHTLPAEYRFFSAGRSGTAEAVVPDPCLWSEELPHLYHADVAALRGEEVVAEFHGPVGLRRKRPAPNWDHIK